jgi:multidrug resistance efflux pump
MAKLAGLALLPFVAALAQDPPKPQAVKATRGDLTVTLELDGWFEPTRMHEVMIRPQALQGVELVVAKAAAHGARVRKGDVLLSVETREADRAVAAADDELRVAESALDKARQELEIGERSDALALERAENERRLAQEKLQSYVDFDAPQERAERELALIRSQDSIDNQKEELAQLKKMYSSEELTTATAEIVVRRTERNLARSTAALDHSKKRFEKLIKVEQPEETKRLELALRQKELDLERLRAGRGHAKLQRELDVRKAEREVAKQRERLERVRADRAALAATAPFDGAVYYGQLKDGRWGGADAMARALKPGEKIQAGQIAMTLVEPAELRFRATLREADWARVAAGMAAEVTAAALPAEPMKGRVEPPAEIASPDGGFELPVRLADANPRLAGGMRGKAKLTLKEVKGALLVPAGCVFEEGGAKKVRLAGGGTRDVKVGETDGRMTQILEGVSEGEEVLPK